MSDYLSLLNSSQSKKNVSKEINNYLSSIVSPSDLLEKASEMKILEFVKIIGIHKNSAEDIKELKNGFFASYGTDNRLFIYDKYYNKRIEGEDLGDWIHHILEITSQEKIEKDIQIIICTNNYIYLNQINVEKNTSRTQRYDYGGMLCLELKKNNYVICGDDGSYHFSDLFSKIIQSKKNKLFDENNRGGLVLNQNLVVFSSNVILPDGEDKLKFYNPNSKKIVKVYENYSFVLSSNGLTLMEHDNKEYNKIFLAACKKYYANQKNGILFIMSLFGENDPFAHKFENTGNFEVYCFCPISIIKNNRQFILKEEHKENEKIERTKTDYFFVGGFDQDTRRGLIKLYKANFSKNVDEIYIEFIQNIEFEKNSRPVDISQINEKVETEKKENTSNLEKNNDNNINKENSIDILKSQKLTELKSKILKERNNFNGFAGPVTSIIQSSNTGNILATCNDGNVYLFTPPNLDYYLLNKDKNYVN